MRGHTRWSQKGSVTMYWLRMPVGFRNTVGECLISVCAQPRVLRPFIAHQPQPGVVECPDCPRLQPSLGSDRTARPFVFAHSSCGIGEHCTHLHSGLSNDFSPQSIPAKCWRMLCPSSPTMLASYVDSATMASTRTCLRGESQLSTAPPANALRPANGSPSPTV